jgi:hypothetical protein
MFAEYGNRYIYATERSAVWGAGQADTDDPRSFGAAKIKMLLQTLLANDYTVAGGHVYIARDGIPMGSAFSSHVSNLTLWMLERLALPTLQGYHIQLGLGPFFYARYADDCLHSSPKNLFKAIMKPILGKASCEYEMDEDEDEYSKGVPFLEVNIKLAPNGQIQTTHYSRGVEINGNVPRLPTQGGATPKSTFVQAVRSFCRTAYVTSTSMDDYKKEIRVLSRKDIHPHYSTASIARIAVQVLMMPKQCRYGCIPNRHALERDIRQYLYK